MHQINIANRIIENRYEMYKNDIILHNLLFMRPTVNSQCPDSFKYKLKNSQSMKNDLYLKNRYFKNQFDEYPFKNNIMKIAEENQGILKRLYEKKSNYNFKKLEKDYVVSQYYKKNICIFPSIDFGKRDNDSFYRISNYKKPFTSKTGIIRLNKKRNYSVLPKNFNKMKDKKEISFYNFNKCLPDNYIKNIHIEELGECLIEIILQNNK